MFASLSDGVATDLTNSHLVASASRQVTNLRCRRLIRNAPREWLAWLRSSAFTLTSTPALLQRGLRAGSISCIKYKMMKLAPLMVGRHPSSAEYIMVLRSFADFSLRMCRESVAADRARVDDWQAISIFRLYTAGRSKRCGGMNVHRPKTASSRSTTLGRRLQAEGALFPGARYWVRKRCDARRSSSCRSRYMYRQVQARRGLLVIVGGRAGHICSWRRRARVLGMLQGIVDPGRELP